MRDFWSSFSLAKEQVDRVEGRATEDVRNAMTRNIRRGTLGVENEGAEGTREGDKRSPSQKKCPVGDIYLRTST